MDLEQLTKHQVVLLTLLVSFVTSIATGIVTVSLMSQAPVSVTRTINQIVEHTVQTVLPAAAQNASSGSVKTVVVHDDDLVAQSIATVQKSVIRIVARGSTELLARGVVIDSRGAALTDRTAVLGSGAEMFDALLPNGVRVPLTLRDPKATSTLLMVDVALGTSSNVVPVSIADASKLRLGQGVIRIGGRGVDSVGQGVIATLPTAGSSFIEANVPASIAGSILCNFFGELVGISTTDSLDHGADTYTTILIPAAVTSAAPKR